MDILLEKVYERDIDLVVMRQFIHDDNFKYLFLNQVGISEALVVSVEHSLSDTDGESDIAVIVQNSDKRIGLLIENKINAIAMPNQYDRYIIRGNRGGFSNQYDEFYVFIIAPNSYLNTNHEAKKYLYKVSYEEIYDYLVGVDLFASSLFQQALDSKRNSYVIVEDKAVTEFWVNYYKMVKTYYPQLYIKEVSGPRGSNATWPGFLFDTKGVRVQHKSDKGFVDFEFSNMIDHYNEFSEYITNFMDDDMSIVKTGKSLSIRLHVPVVDFHKEFNNYISEIHLILGAVARFYVMYKKLDLEIITKIKSE